MVVLNDLGQPDLRTTGRARYRAGFRQDRSCVCVNAQISRLKYCHDESTNVARHLAAAAIQQGGHQVSWFSRLPGIGGQRGSCRERGTPLENAGQPSPASVSRFVCLRPTARERGASRPRQTPWERELVPATKQSCLCTRHASGALRLRHSGSGGADGTALEAANQWQPSESTS